MKYLQEQEVQKAASALLDHQILAFPTDTVYGVGVLFGSLADLQALKEIKHRPETKPIPVMVSSLEMAQTIAVIDDRASRIIETLLPGALTLILPLRPEIDPALFNGNRTVALRIPDSPFVLEMISAIQQPLFVTSANVSGEPAALSAAQAAQALPRAWGVVEGKCANQRASTIVDCTKDDLVILRSGPVSLDTIISKLTD